MAHFAKIENNKVIQVAVVENAVIRDVSGDEQESLGVDFLRAIHSEPDAVWIQCSYNGNIRGAFPSPGWDWSPEDDRFYPPKPYPSWVWNNTINAWDSPIGHPTDELKTTWNEDSQSWV
jgi:hypothetical protein